MISISSSVSPVRHLAVADHVVRVQVVAAVGDEEAHVGQQRAGLEVLAGRLAETVQRGHVRKGDQTVEQLEGQAGDVGGVLGFVVAQRRPGAPRSAVTRPAGGGASRRGCAGSCRAAPPRGGRSREHSSSSTSNVSNTPSRISAPASTMSARLASSPGSRLRCLTLGAAISSLHTSRTSSAVSRKRLNERGGSPPAAACAMAATAWIVPDEPTATSKPCPATSRL